MSMEFLIGRSLANNVMNLMLQPYIERTAHEGSLDWLGLVDQEPDAGLGNGGLGRLAARASSISMATMQLPAMGYGLRYEYGMFRQSIERGWQHEHPDNWLRRQDPGSLAPQRVRRGRPRLHLRDASGQPADRRQSPFDPDRHSVRPASGGRFFLAARRSTACRLWSAAAQDAFDFQDFSSGDFVGALVGGIAAQTLTRVLYPV